MSSIPQPTGATCRALTSTAGPSRRRSRASFCFCVRRRQKRSTARPYRSDSTQIRAAPVGRRLLRLWSNTDRSARRLELNFGEMRAVLLTGYGGVDKLELREVPEPTAAAGEIKVRVEASSINPIDWKLRSGS